ncbi:Protein CBG24022 [Caenorhabditis briggsae]|uniref:Protein CBG24022 n=1 Tax=Caenorhabditis briggsae TaxID=6238 RepID=A8WJT6_CAEBR|nr:Protein CBG24022 [Caenorhabditis briggsae]CAP20729.2 Protein CBG24022 [Caenorhabditis briggsae]
MEVVDYTKHTRDQLRVILRSKKTFSNAEIRSMNMKELIKAIEESDNKQNAENQDATNKESNLQLRNLFPFDNAVFSEYKESFLAKKESDVLKDVYDDSVKIYFSLTCEMKKEGAEELRVDHLNTKNETLHKGDDRKAFFETVKSVLINRLDQNQGRGSGFRLNRIIGLRMFQTRIRPLSGSKYIELPDWIKNKKAVINIKNKDDKCFMWCILAHLFPVEENSERVAKYKYHVSKITFDGFEFPFQVKDVDRFEKKNNLAVNILTHNIEDKEKIDSYKVSRNIKVEINRVVNLLLVTDNSGEGHYCLIKNIDRLMNNKNGTRNKFCIRCHNNFLTKEKFENHLNDCRSNSPIQMIKPSKDYIQFDGIQKTQKHRYVCYADFESVIYKIDSVNYSPKQSWSENIGKHVASAFCVVVVDSFTQKIYDMVSYVGYDTILKFNEYILNISEKLLNIADMKIEQLTEEELKSYNSCKSCPACGNMFHGDKVRDHDHWTGLYRGPLCNACNLLKRRNNFIPVFFHNLKGYDSHLIISDEKSSDLLKKRGVEIKSISANIEKFISFSYFFHDEDRKRYEIRFLDSLGFMPSSLDYLSSNLQNDECVITKKYYDNENIFSLLRRKGVYPYDFMDSFKKYSNTELPPIENFYNSLSSENISSESYEYALKVWNETNCKTLEDYTRIYMVNDVLLLADVFETFRNVSLKEYKLDPCWYYTSPGLAWEAMLFKTGVKLQTIKDIEMYNFIEKGIRGGMCNAMLRYSKANNKYMSNYNPEEESKYLLYLDANNLYGWAMSQKLPYDDFKFMNAAEFSVEMLENLNSQGRGCILEVDLDYPDSLHDKHNDLPFCPENKRVGSTNKLINDFSPKRNYVIHYKNLLQVLEHGLMLKKVHRIVTFKESNWLAPYIELNTNLRKNAKNDFEKDFFKLMNNSVFGKTMENVRHRVDVKVVSDMNKVMKLAGSNNFKQRHIINKNMILVEMTQKGIKLDKPIYVGMSILDLSKYLMYEFHYDVMLPKYPSNLRLCYQDTDSFIYEVKTDDVYEDMSAMKEHFDFSDYPKENKLHSIENKKVIGKFKDELNGKIMTEIVAFRPKQYAFKTDEGSEQKKNKGIKKSVVKKEMTFNDYKNCLENRTIERKQQTLISSSKHEISSVRQNKVVLNNIIGKDKETKRYFVDNINSLAFGHYRIKI